jgi:hypothetical protein
MADDDDSDDLTNEESCEATAALAVRLAELQAEGLRLAQTASDSSWVIVRGDGSALAAVEATDDHLYDWLELIFQYDLQHAAAESGYQVVRYGVDLQRPHVCSSLELIDVEGRTVAKCDVGEEGATEALEAMLTSYMESAVSDGQEPGEA